MPSPGPRRRGLRRPIPQQAPRRARPAARALLRHTERTKPGPAASWRGMVEHRLADWLEEGYVSSFRTACLILGNRADAEEAVQDAYLRAWRFRDSLTAVPSIRPWLYRVVVNSCYSKLRREIPHRDHRAGDQPLAHVPEASGGPEALAER